ncbi:hypothetical protein SASPL_114243 [Salvia splendens]|uniref:CCR4-NOT transcription complex subunit 9 n=1 Tax=Salvia splendens TaxID=180675 RepID=A0A8X9A1U8_SALSN|nr:hypothetical protein SASPL_114243 [Salvia splendens]
MSTLPPPLNLKAVPFEATGSSSAAANKDRRMQSSEQLVLDLCNPDLRENALLELSKKRELFQDLAPLLWNSFGTIAALLQEIVSIYPVLSPPNLTPSQSNRVCNALALLQRGKVVGKNAEVGIGDIYLLFTTMLLPHVACFSPQSSIAIAPAKYHWKYWCVASHLDTRMLFLNAHIPLYLYPFLNTTSKSRPFEYLRLTSLGVIGALVKENLAMYGKLATVLSLLRRCNKVEGSRTMDGIILINGLWYVVDDTEVISFLLSTEIIPLCLRTMEMGSELSKTVATFIVQKILLDDVGLEYICTTAERFFAVGRVLGNMVAALAEQPSSRLLKHIIRCYLRLSDNPRACDALRSCLPDMLRDATFSSCLREDPTTRRWLQQLLLNVQGPRVAMEAGGFDHLMG